MTDKRKQRAVDHLNSPRVKSDIIWIAKMTIVCIILIVLSLIFAPVIDDYWDTYHPFTQLAITVSVLIGIFVWVKIKQR